MLDAGILNVSSYLCRDFHWGSDDGQDRIEKLLIWSCLRSHHTTGNNKIIEDAGTIQEK